MTLPFEWQWALASLLAGVAVGLFYFGGLWWTVRRLPVSRRPALLTLSSYLIRVTAAVGAIFVISQGRWERILILLAGFLTVRFLMVRRLGAVPADPSGGATT
jgi:F1F0 ATPase subunit 2